MKPIHLLLGSLIVILIAMISSCTGYGDYGDTGPKFVELGTTPIGSDGGVVSFSGITIEIPAGAFDGVNEVKVLFDESGEFIDNEGIAPLFRVEGFPEEIKQGITFRFDLNGSVEGTPLAGLGRLAYLVSQRKNGHPLLPVPGILDGNQMIVELSKNSNMGIHLKLETLGIDLTKNLNLGFNIAPLQNKEQKLRVGGHFLITNKANQAIKTDKLEAYLEAAFDTCSNMGFNLHSLQNPISVSVIKTNDYWGAYASDDNIPDQSDLDKDILNPGLMEISDDALSNDLELRATIIHEFFHLVQDLYEFTSPDHEPEQAWLEEALSTWIEAKLVGNSKYISDVLPSRAANMLNGWQKTGSDEVIADHGYGMAPMINRFHATYKDEGIVHIFNEIKNGVVPGDLTDPVDAIKDAMVSPVAGFWHGVLTDYIAGSIYDGSLSKEIVDDNSNYQAKLNIRREQDFSQTVNLDMQDLSGALIKVDVSESVLAEISRIKFSISDPQNCGMTAMKNTANQPIKYISQSEPGSNGTLSISTIGEIYGSGSEVILLISNGQATGNYDETAAVDLTMEIQKSGDEDLDSKWEFTYDATMYGLVRWNDTLDMRGSFTVRPSYGNFFLTESDGHYSVSYTFDNDTYGDLRAEGSINFDATPDAITNLVVNLQWKDLSDESVFVKEVFSVANIPLSATDGKLRTYSAGSNCPTNCLFQNKEYVSRTGDSSREYIGQPDSDLAGSESILIYLREPHM